MEKPHGGWNTLELVCLGTEAIHVVNGKVVMRLQNSRVQDAAMQWVKLEKGRIQIQSEGAECWYRNIAIRPITQIPEEYR